MIRNLLSLPAVHFVVIGAGLFLLQNLGAADPSRGRVDPTAHTIVVDATTLRELREGFRRAAGREATDDEERGLLRDHADQEILYREARRRGLDRGDRSVKWRLIQKMQFLEDRPDDGPEGLYREALALGLDEDDLIIRRLLIEKMRLLIQMGAVREVPSEDMLQDFFTGIAENFRQPARVTLVHVFLSADKRGDAVADDAEELIRRLRADGTHPDDAIALGDVYPFGHRLRANSKNNLAKLLGPDFAHEAIALLPGAWHGPIASAYGMHLVWIEARQESAIPALEEVRGQVTQRYLANLREEELAREMDRLRSLYVVSVEQAERQ